MNQRTMNNGDIDLCTDRIGLRRRSANQQCITPLDCNRDSAFEINFEICETHYIHFIITLLINEIKRKTESVILDKLSHSAITLDRTMATETTVQHAMNEVTAGENTVTS